MSKTIAYKCSKCGRMFDSLPFAVHLTQSAPLAWGRCDGVLRPLVYKLRPRRKTTRRKGEKSVANKSRHSGVSSSDTAGVAK